MGSRRKGSLFAVAAFVLLSIAGSALYSSSNVDAKPPTFDPQAAVGSESLVIEPQQGMTPVAQLIENASSSIDVVMYEFEDPQIEQLLAQRAKLGVVVRVILDNGYFGAGSSANQQAFDYFNNNGAQARWSPSYFALTHQKTIVVDGREALIMSFNFTPQYYKGDRDFGILDSDAGDVAAIEQAFDADWNGQNTPAQDGDDLVWSPGSREQILSLINTATSSLDIYNEEMQDTQTISALEAAAKRGVNVEVVMTYSSQWKQAFTDLSNAGVHVRTYKASAPLYIHAKMVLEDGAQAFVGSENFSAGSLDQNRELGIVVTDPSLIAQLSDTFNADRQGATPYLVQ